RHPLTQEVADHSELAERRAARHAAVARAMEELAPERLNERAALLAQHWERAGDRLAAARGHGRAADWLGRSDLVGALEHWRAARALLNETPASMERDRLLLTACTDVMLLGAQMAERTEDAAALYDEARSLADRVGDPLLTGRLLAVYAPTLALTGETTQPLALIGEAERLAERSGDPELRIAVASAAAHLYEWLGRLRQQLEVTQRALELLDAHPSLDAGGRRGRLFLAQSWALDGAGRFNEATARLQVADDIAEQTNDLDLRGHVAVERMWLEYMRGNIDAAFVQGDVALRTAQHIGSVAIAGPTVAMLGALHCVRAEWDSAINLLEMIAERIRNQRQTFQPIVLGFLAEAYLGNGAAARAGVPADAAVDAARQHGTRGYEARARMAQVRVILRSEGDAARARLAGLFAELADLIVETGGHALEPYVLLDRGGLAGGGGERPGCVPDLNT